MRKSEVVAAESVACMNKALYKLRDIWEEIGIPEDQRLERTNTVKKHVQDLLDDMIVEEEALKKRLFDSIEKCRHVLSKLCLELELPMSENQGEMTILQKERDLRTRVEVLVKERSQRLQQLKALLEVDHELCDILCSEPYGIDEASVPSLEQLEAFRRHIASQTAEKERRHEEFVDLRNQAILLMGDLDHFPETTFEKDIVGEDEEAICLSRENIRSLQLLICQLEGRKAENEALCEAHRERIQRLWDRLQVPQEERQAFSEHLVSSKRKNLEALQAEVERLEELKLLNIRNVTDAIRSEIAVLWEKCFCSTEQRQAFVPYFSEEFTEELLGMHDAEIQRLKQHYEDHKELFEGVHQWQDNWRLFLELEKKATDPARFNNRGGNLLKEEKQRTELHKSLPKLEKKLKAEIDSWESTQGREFLVHGQMFLQYVAEQWELYRIEKENEKLERQIKKNKQTEVEMLYGTMKPTPTKRRLLTNTTPNKTRKFNATSSSASVYSNSTMRSGFGVAACRSPPSANKIPLVRTPGRAKPPHQGLHGSNKENMGQAKGTPVSGALMTPASPQCNFSVTSVASTYSEFLDLVNISSVKRDFSKAGNTNSKPAVLNSTISDH